jgi:hypothetical protein
LNHQKSIKIVLICISICLMGLNLIGTASADDTNNVCHWDWKWHFTNHIGEYNKAPPGFTYIIVDLYLKNNADTSIHTNPAYWKLIIDGIQHDEDSATFSDYIGNQDVDVFKGGELETKIVYKIKGYPDYASLKYDDKYGPTMEHINHYNNTSI